jgi:hypothetical protein
VSVESSWQAQADEAMVVGDPATKLVELVTAAFGRAAGCSGG